MKVGVGVRVGPAKSRRKPGQTYSLVRGRCDGLRRSVGSYYGRSASFGEEERLVLLGLSQSKHLLAVMYVDRGEAIRIISARRATRRERRTYEEVTY